MDRSNHGGCDPDKTTERRQNCRENRRLEKGSRIDEKIYFMGSSIEELITEFGENRKQGYRYKGIEVYGIRYILYPLPFPLSPSLLKLNI